ncbi:MAG: hypothetical protein J6K04_10190 [Lachnospiraceae bacterium]|nr:hypothetical protein [Lachnospiraceae bacterium]
MLLLEVFQQHMGWLHGGEQGRGFQICLMGGLFRWEAAQTDVFSTVGNGCAVQRGAILFFV